MMLDHDMSMRAKKARPLVVGERCYVLGLGNKWIDSFISLQVSLTVAEAMTHRWRPLGDILRGTALTSNQEALTFQ